MSDPERCRKCDAPVAEGAPSCSVCGYEFHPLVVAPTRKRLDEAGFRQIISTFAGVLGVLAAALVVAATAAGLLWSYFAVLRWAVQSYGSWGNETTWEDYGSILFLWIPPVALCGAVGACMSWLLDRLEYLPSFGRRGWIVGGLVAGALIYIFVLVAYVAPR